MIGIAKIVRANSVSKSFGKQLPSLSDELLIPSIAHLSDQLGQLEDPTGFLKDKLIILYNDDTLEKGLLRLNALKNLLGKIETTSPPKIIVVSDNGNLFERGIFICNGAFDTITSKQLDLLKKNNTQLSA